MSGRPGTGCSDHQISDGTRRRDQLAGSTERRTKATFINLIARCRDARKSKHIATLRTDMNVTHSLIAILALIVFLRITHPVAPASSLPAWQQLISEAAHWLLYAPVLAITMTGWIFASERGWSISLFSVPLPMLPTEGSLLANAIGKWHGTMEWALLLVISAHVAAAMAHTFIFRDRIMQRMLPEKPMVVRTRNLKSEVVAMKPAEQSRAG